MLHVIQLVGSSTEYHKLFVIRKMHCAFNTSSSLASVSLQELTVGAAFRGQAIHNAKIELQNIETESRVLKDALAK